jgi:hypothetical protein
VLLRAREPPAQYPSSSRDECLTISGATPEITGWKPVPPARDIRERSTGGSVLRFGILFILLILSKSAVQKGEQDVQDVARQPEQVNHGPPRIMLVFAPFGGYKKSETALLLG